MAMACFRLVTFLPLRPLFSFPRFISCISFFTCLPAAGLYFLLEDFFAPFFELDFLVLFFADDFLVLFDEDDDFFALFFFVAIRLTPAMK